MADKTSANTKPPRKKRKTHPSSTGKVVGVIADQTNWRIKMQTSRLKFDDPQKQVYLAELRLTGRKGRAAQAAGVCGNTVDKHRDSDPDFAEAAAEAVETYNDHIAQHVHDAGTIGDLKPVFYKGKRMTEPILDENGVHLKDPKGELRWRFVEVWEKNYRMLEIEAKRGDPTYRDKTSIDLNTTGGGVILAPAGTTPEEAIARNAELNAASDEVHQRRVAEVEEAKRKVGDPK